MQSTCRDNTLRWLLSLCFWLALAFPATRAAAEAKEIFVPLDERLLGHLETTAQHLAAKVPANPALSKDFHACGQDKKITGDTPDEISVSIASRHPRVTAALAAEGWKPGDFYVAFATVASMPFASELNRGGVSDANDDTHRNVVFYNSHKTRILAVIQRLGRAMGIATE